MARRAATQRSPVASEPEPGPGPARIGLIALSTDLTSERDAARLLPPERAVLHVSRVLFENPTNPENLRRMHPRLADAADLLPTRSLAAIWYSCTSASVVLGDAEVRAAFAPVCPGVPVVTPPGAALEGFAALGIRRIALLTPYLPETTEAMADYFAANGLELVRIHCLGLEDDRDMARVSAEVIRAAAVAADAPEAEGLFVSCTALPALAVLAQIEAEIGKPVVSSNQAALWRLLHHAGLPEVRGPGTLFSAEPGGHRVPA